VKTVSNTVGDGFLILFCVKSIAFVSGIKLKNHGTQKSWVLVLPICRSEQTGISSANPQDKTLKSLTFYKGYKIKEPQHPKRLDARF
jgi:hypothetical protein